jgi:hypothetical protein
MRIPPTATILSLLVVKRRHTPARATEP